MCKQEEKEEQKAGPPVKWGLFIIAYPFLEIFIFLASSDYLGVEYVIGWTILTILIGIIGFKLNAFKKMSYESQWRFLLGGETSSYDPEVVSYLLTKSAYFLILIPGFLTDGIGFLLLIPLLRNALSIRAIKYLIQKKQRESNEQPGI